MKNTWIVLNIVSLSVFLFVALFLSAIHYLLDFRIILLERFLKGGAWIEIVVIAFYGAFLYKKMENPVKAIFWRKFSWSLFSIVFFCQFFIGIVGFEKFLMTGELHLPVPAMILSGPIYRGELTFMVFLFLSTIVLTGPAWCSHLCYFGGIDNAVAGNKNNKTSWRHKYPIKYGFFFLVIFGTILFRIFNIDKFYSLIGGIIIGIIGVVLIAIVSSRKGKMANCILFCPIGTLVMYLKQINPIRMYIDYSCTNCGVCSSVCNYDALTIADIKNRKPGLTCTYCGDCLSVCHKNAIKYKLFNLDAVQARKVFLFFTVSFHAIFMALARI